MTTSSSASLTIPVDAEHSGIRGVVLLAFVVLIVVAFVIANNALPANGLNLLAMLIAFVVSGAVTVVLERILKRVWSSGRAIILESDRVVLSKRGVTEQEMRADQPVQTLFWRFEVQKRTRIPKGWSMLGCALENDGEYLIAYTFVSPDALNTIERRDRFRRLISRKDAEGQKTAREDMRLAGEQRRLREAEAHRWNFGAEMTADDFTIYLTELETRFTEWMPIN
jgi:hypothetical protein